MKKATSSEAKTKRQCTPFKILNGNALASTAPEKIPGLVDGLLIKQGVSMVVGKPKIGKTSFARQVAVATAEGKDFLGRKTLQGEVLYLNLEGHTDIWRQHFKKLGLRSDQQTMHVIHETMPYDGEEGLRRLEEAIQSIPGLRLVIVDPASKLLRLLDSFDPTEVGIGIEKLEALAKKYNLHLMFTVHAKKKATDDIGDAAMGSTSFRGGTDTNIFLRKIDGQRIFSAEQRWCIGIEPTLLVYDEATQAVSLGGTVEAEEEARHAVKERKTEERVRKEILDALVERENPTQGELLGAVTGKTATKLRILNQLVKDGDIVTAVDGRATRYQLRCPGLDEIPVEEAA